MRRLYFDRTTDIACALEPGKTAQSCMRHQHPSRVSSLRAIESSDAWFHWMNSPHLNQSGTVPDK